MAAPVAAKVKAKAQVGSRFFRNLARRYMLSVAGMTAITVAAFEANTIAGWIIIGLSCFILEQKAAK
jgi:hypothetical protein